MLKKNKIKYSIVIPCYNEFDNLDTLISMCENNLCNNNIEVILIDNGSTDKSDIKLSKIKNNEKSFLKKFKIKENIGYGNGIVYGLTKCKGEFIGWTHADLQTDPLDVLRGFKKINSKKDFIKGKRRGRSFFDVFFSIGMSIFESILLNKIFWDINGQPTLFHRDLFLNWKNAPKDFSLDLFAYYMAKKNKYNIKRINVDFSDRKFGVSSWNNGLHSKIKLIIKTLNFSFNLRKNVKLKSYYENNLAKNNKD
jgi:glycosyltransferase involved in cell wall biosynthesis